MFKQEMRNAGVTEEEIDYGLKFCSPLGHDFFEGMTNPEIKEMVKEYLETRTPESVDCIVKDMNKADYEYGRAKKNITIYKSELKKIGIAGEELLTRKEAIEEGIFLGLRRISGIDIDWFERRFDCSLKDLYRDTISKLTREGMLDPDDDNIRLTRKGLLLSNEVLAELI